MIPNQTSTRFSHDPEVGVKWTWILGLAASQVRISSAFVGGVVVHHQVQLAVGVAAGHMLEERQELLMSVPVLAQPGDLPGGDLQGGEQRGGAIPDVVMGALLGMPGLHRQRLLGPVQRLDLGLLVHTQHDRVLRRRQIQPDDVGDLGDQLGIGGELERLRPPRRHPERPPRLQHRGVVQLQPVREQPRRPMGNPQPGRRRPQRLSDDLPLVDRLGPARPVHIDQPGHASIHIP